MHGVYQRKKGGIRNIVYVRAVRYNMMVLLSTSASPKFSCYIEFTYSLYTEGNNNKSVCVQSNTPQAESI